jgi:glutamate/tyrosine decarboxylase-like PLP-dependent enzyme
MNIDAMRDDFAKLLDKIANGPIVPNVTAAEIRKHLAAHYDFSAPVPLEDLVSDVEMMLHNWQVHVTHPRYFGLFNPSVTLASVVADALVAMYNPQLANWRTAPAPNEIERHTLGWLTKKFGLPEDAWANFTTGGSEANQSAVIVALTKTFPGFGEDGLRVLSGQPMLYVTSEAHHSYHKIAHMVGLGRRSVRIVAVDRASKLDLQDLRRLVEEDRKKGLVPFMVVGTGGTTGAGLIDPLAEIGTFCREAGLWFHVDAAWGGGAMVSPKLAPYLAGIEMADSITCDAHKWFSVPMGSGMFFCRDAEAVAETFRAEVSYMPGNVAGMADEPKNPFTTSVQWSRRFIGLKLFMTIAEHGEAGCIEMIEHQTRMGDVLRERLIATGWRVVNDTPLPLVCFTRDGLSPSLLLAAMREEQTAWMSEAVIDGEPVMRACITSFRTTESEVDWVVGEMNRLFAQGEEAAMHTLATAGGTS